MLLVPAWQRCTHDVCIIVAVPYMAVMVPELGCTTVSGVTWSCKTLVLIRIDCGSHT